MSRFSELNVRGRVPLSVFDTFGTSENTATMALAWVMSRSAAFSGVLLGDLRLPDGQLKISAQQSGPDRGFTDLEIKVGTSAAVILEAKVGWQLPSSVQLRRYLPRLVSSGFPNQLLLTISAADQSYARRQRPTTLDGIRLEHRSWSDLSGLANRARDSTRNTEERLWLNEFEALLGEYRHMQRSDNLAYCVVLSPDPVAEGPYSFIDVVRDGFYYHPVDTGRWPTVAPTYMAFRYGGELRSVHHVDEWKIVASPSDEDRRWSRTSGPRLLYRLGPPMKPEKRLPNGGIYANGRLWIALDLLLSGAAIDIHQAYTMTRERSKTPPPEGEKLVADAAEGTDPS